MLTNLPAVLSGADMIVGLGDLETANMVAFEQIVVDHEIAQLYKRIKDGVNVSEEKNYFNDVAVAGPGGHFLMFPNTLKACRSEEFIVPELSIRNTYESWAALGRPDIYDRARKKVSKILSEPQKNQLPDEVTAKLDVLMERADNELQ